MSYRLDPIEDSETWADELQIDLLRHAGSLRRLELAGQLTAMAWNASRAEIDRLYPNETQAQRDFRFLSLVYGERIAREIEACLQSQRKHSDGTPPREQQ